MLTSFICCCVQKRCKCNALREGGSGWRPHAHRRQPWVSCRPGLPGDACSLKLSLSAPSGESHEAQSDKAKRRLILVALQVYNLTTYPNLVGLLEQLGVDSEPSDMSFALSMDGGTLEWGSHGLHSIFAQRRNMLSPSFLRMVWDVIRFGQLAPRVRTKLANAHDAPASLSRCLQQAPHTPCRCGHC